MAVAVIVLVLAGLLVAFGPLLADHELLFGSATVFAVLMTAAVFASVFARRHVENDAALTFVLVAALSVAALIMIAHDWARRQLVIAALVVAAALSLFIVRIGYESLTVPPQWERAQIAAQATAQEKALEAQHALARPGLLDAAATARAILSGILARTTALNVDSGLLAQANVILHDANTSLTTTTPAAFSRFDVLVVNEPVTFPPAATTELADAVHTLGTSEAAAAKQIDHAALDQAICAVTGHQIRKNTGTCGTGGPDEITSNRVWVVAKHDLDVELATYRAAVTGTADDQAALKTVIAQQPGVEDNISVLAAIENGPETLWGSVFRSAGPPLVPGPLAWVVLGVLLLGLLGWLLKVNASQLAGPVEVLPGDDNDKRLVTVLRVAVLRNVAEPGAAPGAPSANPVTTLLDIASGPLGAAGKIVQVVLSVAGRRYGYQVSIDVTTDPTVSGTPPAAGAAGNAGAATATSSPRSTTVLARVKSVSGGITLDSHTFQEPDDTDAVQAAGLWAAGCILGKSSRIPSWAAWNAATARALAVAYNTTDRTIPLPVLQEALQAAPASGLLLTNLGHSYELAGRRADAIGCYARAVTAHPHYWIARYRLAVALGAMRHDEKGWVEKSLPDRQDDLRAVEPAIIALHVYVGSELEQLQTDPDGAPGHFKTLAKALLKALATDTRYKYRLVSALRRSERESTWPSLGLMSTSPAHRFHSLVTSAYMSLGDEHQLSELSKEAAKPGSWWQISYNAACGYASSIATTKDPQKQQEYEEKALCLLEQTLVRPGIHQLSAGWVTADSALSSLAGSPRFIRFLTQLRPGG